MRRVFIAIILLMVSLTLAHSWTHGAISSIDSSWTCFTASNCGAATAHNFGAACDGVTDDSSALAAWTAYGVAANPSLVKLYIPSGANCHFAGQNTLTWDSQASGLGINNWIISAYGATVDFVTLGGAVFNPNDSTSIARIATVSAGATSVTVTDGNVGRFSVGDWVMNTGDCLDPNGGLPPNFQFYDSFQVTGISSNDISFSPTQALRYTYKSTWPVCALAGSIGSGGPATLIRLHPSWNQVGTLYGLTITNPFSIQVNDAQRDATLVDVQLLHGTISPSGVKSFTFLRGSSVEGFEIDKLADTILFDQTTVGQTASQSPSPTNLTIQNSTVNCSINGSPLNLTVSNVAVVASVSCDGRIGVGPSFYGHGNSVTVSNSTFPVGDSYQREMLVSDFTYSSGTFTLAKSIGTGQTDLWLLQWVPGFSYKFGYHNSKSATCTPAYSFKVVDLSEDVTNLYFTTGTWKQDGSPISTPAVLPTPTCADTPMLVSYPAETITQTNTGLSPDLTQYAPP